MYNIDEKMKKNKNIEFQYFTGQVRYGLAGPYSSPPGVRGGGGGVPGNQETPLGVPLGLHSPQTPHPLLNRGSLGE